MMVNPRVVSNNRLIMQKSCLYSGFKVFLQTVNINTVNNCFTFIWMAESFLKLMTSLNRINGNRAKRKAPGTGKQAEIYSQSCYRVPPSDKRAQFVKCKNVRLLESFSSRNFPGCFSNRVWRFRVYRAWKCFAKKYIE